MRENRHLSRLDLLVVLLLRRSLVESTEDLIKSSESALSPDDETPDVTTRSKLEQVEAVDAHNLNTRQVPESLDDTVILIVDDERTTALTMTPVPHLTLASTEFSGV